MGKRSLERREVAVLWEHAPYAVGEAVDYPARLDAPASGNAVFRRAEGAVAPPKRHPQAAGAHVEVLHRQGRL